MQSFILSLLMLAASSLPAWAGSLSIDFNDRSTQIGYLQKLATPQYSDLVLKARYLYNEDTSTNLAGIAAGVIGSPGSLAGVQFGIDVALNGGRTIDEQDILALGLGFLVGYNPPALPGFGLDTRIVYSPEVFTFMDADDYFEWGVGASYSVLPNAKVRLVYQSVQVEIKNHGNRDLDETARIGISFEF